MLQNFGVEDRSFRHKHRYADRARATVLEWSNEKRRTLECGGSRRFGSMFARLQRFLCSHPLSNLRSEAAQSPALQIILAISCLLAAIRDVRSSNPALHPIPEGSTAFRVPRPREAKRRPTASTPSDTDLSDLQNSRDLAGHPRPAQPRRDAAEKETPAARSKRPKKVIEGPHADCCEQAYAEPQVAPAGQAVIRRPEQVRTAQHPA